MVQSADTSRPLCGETSVADYDYDVGRLQRMRTARVRNMLGGWGGHIGYEKAVNIKQYFEKSSVK